MPTSVLILSTSSSPSFPSPYRVRISLSYIYYPTKNWIVNVVLTLLIASRLLWMSSRIKRELGENHAKKYTSIAAMLVECALPYSAVGLAFIVSYVVNHPIQEPLIAALSQLVVGIVLKQNQVQNAHRVRSASVPNSLSGALPRDVHGQEAGALSPANDT
jgi:hypothetical protein